jgi:signal transduction histidine kinase
VHSYIYNSHRIIWNLTTQPGTRVVKALVIAGGGGGGWDQDMVEQEQVV